jgi:hypothetical protein
MSQVPAWGHPADWSSTMIRFLIDPSVLTVRAGRGWTHRARGELSFCTPVLAGRLNEADLMRPFQSDRLWSHPPPGQRGLDDVSWISPMAGTEPGTSLHSMDDLVERCRVAVAAGAVLVARRPGIIDGLLARGSTVVTFGQPTFDDTLERMIVDLGDHTRHLMYALFRPSRCRFALLGGPSLDLIPDEGRSEREFILLDRGPLWGGGRTMARPSVVDLR